MNVNRLQDGLGTVRFGRELVFLHEVDSTSDCAKELAGYGASEGTVVIAETQKRGRGRQGREWVSPAGGLWFSVVLKPTLSAGEAVRLVFVASVAVAETLRRLYDLKVETMWPNDVMVKGRKICGVLTEMSTTGEKVNFVIVGIGVNANFGVEVLPESLRELTTSLRKEFGRDVRLEELFRALLECLEREYDLFVSGGFSGLLDEWKRCAVFLHREVEVASGDARFNGLALDVDHEGALVLKLNDGETRRFFVGDVSIKAR
jgi:BirA family biotin operon repressor/biotin-[acetyl-CoA-carboxylase] ligase